MTTTENIDSSINPESGEGAESLPTEQGEQQAIVNEEVIQPLDYAAQFEQETGYKDIHSMNEANQKLQNDLQKRGDDYKNKFEQAQINSAILAESSAAVSRPLIHEILGNKAQCDEHGNVTIDGLSASDAVRKLLNQYPFLEKAQGSAGSGAPTSSGVEANSMSRTAYQQLSQRERSEFINEGGKVRD